MSEVLGRVGLRGRLVAAIALVLALALGLSFVAVHRGTESSLRGRLDDDLRAEVDGIQAHLDSSGADSQAELAAARAYINTQSFGPAAKVIAVTVPAAGTATNQPDLLGLDPPTERESTQVNEAEARQAQSILRSAPGLADLPIADVGNVRLLTRRVSIGQGPAVTVRVGEPLQPVDRALSGLSGTFAAVGLTALALGMLAGFLLAARIAGPLRAMARTAQAVDAGDLSHRLPVPPARDEMRTVALSFNGMLARLQAAFARQRRFVADASHELRTPLTVIKGQVDVLGRSAASSSEVARVSGLVSTEVDRMERMVGDLLNLARSDEGMVLKREWFGLAARARDVFEAMGPTVDRKLALGRMDDGDVDGDPDLLSQLVRVLARNAIEHTSPGGTIRLGVGKTDRAWEVTMEDDGPGVPPGERARIFERFYRTDASRSRETGGSGLGLAIASDIAVAHGGSIRVGDSQLGGAEFVVSLPRLAGGTTRVQRISGR